MYKLTDGAGKEIEIGKRYGYSITQNGCIHSVVGIADKVTELKVTLRDVEVRSGVYGKISGPKKEEKKRSIYAASVFQIAE
jgi:hypothetical protein